MPKRLKYLAPIILFFAFTSFAQAQTLVVMGDEQDYNDALTLINFLRGEGVPVIKAEPSYFDNYYKNHQYYILMGGPESEPVIRNFIKGVLDDETWSGLEGEPYGNMILLEDVWKSGQQVLLFIGKDHEAVAKARTLNKSLWLDYFADWFGLEINWMMKVY